MLRSRYLLARRGGIPLALPRSSSSGRRTTSAQGQGDLRITVRASPSSTSPRASHSSSTSHRLGFPDEYAGSSDRAGPSISFGAPADDGVSITASGDELGSGEDDSAALPPSGRVALPESDPELTAMLSRAAESIGLHYRRPPSPERSRLDDWFLGAQAERRQPPPVPFFPEVHEEVTRSWKAPFSARNRPSASSVLTTLDGGAAQGYVEVPPVERAIAMQLCPQGAAAWRGNPRLPSRACKFSSALTAKAYGAAGQAASALHAMALLQVHQAKALKQLHEGDADPGVLQELRTATDLALRATKVTARALGQTMSTLVFQERHLWLTLADMKESDKHRFLDSPISQAGLFGEAVEDFAQQFSAAQKQTEAFRHILPRRSAAVSTPPPAAAPPSARRRGRPPAASTSAPARPQQQPALWPQRGAGRRRPAQPASAPAKPVKRQGRRRPWDGRPGAFGSCSSGDGDRTTPSPGGGPGGESFVSFLFCSATDPRVSGTQNFNKRAVSFSSGSLVPLREAGIRILNYLDDWLILAQSRALLCEHRDMVLSHLSRLGLQVNREKSKLSPTQRISFLGMELDSVNLTARLSEERAQSMLRCLESLQRKRAVPLKHFQRLLGHMASSAAITPLGLLHMRPLQRWLHDRVPRWAWRHGTYRVSLTPSCRRTFSPWSDLAFLRAGVPLEQVSRHVVVSTDASATGWGAMCNGHAAAGLWTGPQLQWHINCLELLAVWLALRRFRTLLHEKHILVRSDNTATVVYINHQGGLRSRRMSQLARHLLLWSQKHLRSLRAVHVPGELNCAADELSRQHALPGEWRLHPEVLQLIWRRFGDAQVDLFASPDTSHCQLFFSLSEGTLGTDALACSWPRGLRKYAFPPVSLLAQTLCKVREDEEQVLLVAPYWPNRTWFPELLLLATAPPWQIPLRRDLLSQRGGTLWHPRPDLWNLHVWSLDGTRRF